MATPHLTRNLSHLVSLSIGGNSHLLTIARPWNSKTFSFSPVLRKYANVVAHAVPPSGLSMYDTFKTIANRVNSEWAGMQVVNDWHRDTSGEYNSPPVSNYSRQCGDRAIFAYWSDKGAIYKDATGNSAEIGCSRVFQKYDLTRLMLTGVVVENMKFWIRLWCGSHLVTNPSLYGGLARAAAGQLDGNGTMLMKIGNHTLTPDEISNGYELNIMGGATNQGYHTSTNTSYKGYAAVLPYWAWADGRGEGRVVVWTKGANLQKTEIDTDRYYYDMPIEKNVLTDLKGRITSDPTDVCFGFGIKIGAGLADSVTHFAEYTTQTTFVEKVELIVQAGGN